MVPALRKMRYARCMHEVTDALGNVVNVKYLSCAIESLSAHR